MRTRMLWATFLLCVGLAVCAHAKDDVLPQGDQVKGGVMVAAQDEGGAPYTLETGWVKQDGEWRLRLAMPEAEPGRYEVGVRAASQVLETTPDATGVAKNKHVSIEVQLVLAKGSEVFIDLGATDKEDPLLVEALKSTLIVITVTPKGGGQSHIHVLEPFEENAIEPQPYNLELGWIEREDGWCIRLMLPDAPPGDYLIFGEAQLPDRTTMVLPDGLEATQTHKWEGTVKVPADTEIYIAFSQADEEMINTLRSTTFEFTVTPIDGGQSYSYTLEPEQR